MHSELEKTGSHYDLEQYLEAREDCLSAIDSIFKRSFEGMTEKDGHLLIEDELKKRGSKKRWHPNKFRIGINTNKSFKETSEDVSLKKGDLLFIDIDPVFGHLEADIGRSFLFQSEDKESLRLKNASEAIFHELQALWQKHALSGKELYIKAQEITEKMGYQFNPKMAGHRLGDFPHALVTRESLSNIDFSPAEYLWVLEVHIICPKTNRGSFYEDILKN